MKRYIIARLTIVAAALVCGFMSLAAEDMPLTISRTDRAIKISWLNDADVGTEAYQVLVSTNLPSWQKQFTLNYNWFYDFPLASKRFYRVQKIILPTLTVTKYPGFADRTVVPGSSYAKLGSFVVTAGPTEGMAVSYITIHLDDTEYSSSTLTRMYLVDHATGEQVGTHVTSLSRAQLYNINFTLPASGSKIIDLFGAIRSGTTTTNWQAEISAKGSGVVTGLEISSQIVPIQTITFAPGNLTVSKGFMPDSDILIASSTGNYVAQFTFSATHEGYTIDKLKLRIPWDFAMSTAGVTIKYKNKFGVIKQASGVFVTSSEQLSATATFSGLTFYVPADEDANLDIYIDMASLASSGFSGAYGAVTLLADQGFNAIGDAGDAVTSFGQTDLTGNTFYIRKSKPTFAKLDAGNDPVNGPIYRFSVVASPAGNIEIKLLSFNIATVGCEVSGLYLYDPVTAEQLTDIPFNPKNGIARLAIGQAGQSAGSYISTNVLIISFTPKVYEVRGTVTGFDKAGDSIIIGFEQDAGPYPDSPVIEGVDSRFATIWSDRRHGQLLEYAGGWSNGYLLKDMTQKQIFVK